MTKLTEPFHLRKAIGNKVSKALPRKVKDLFVEQFASRSDADADSITFKPSVRTN